MRRKALAGTGLVAPHILDCGRFDGRGEPFPVAQGATPLDNSSYSLIRLVEGGASITLESKDGPELPEGTVILLPPGTRGRLRAGRRSRLIQAAFDVAPQPRTAPGERRRTRHRDRRLQPSPREVWGLDLPRRVPEPAATAAGLLLVRLSSTYWRDPLSHYLANAELAAWLADLVARVAGRATVHPLARGGDPVTGSLELVTTALSHRVTVDELAVLAGCSRATYFRRAGRPATRVRERRLLRAAELLRTEPDLPVAKVGLVVGYRSPAAFSHAFKRRFGATPREWRGDQDSR